MQIYGFQEMQPILPAMSECMLFCSELKYQLSCSLFNYQKADNKMFVCKFSKNFKSKLYHIENSKTRGQTV